MFNAQALLDKRKKLKQEIKSIDIEVRQTTREWLPFNAAQMKDYKDYVEDLQKFLIYDSNLKSVCLAWFRTDGTLGVHVLDTRDPNYIKKYIKHWMPFPAPPEKT